MVILSQILLQLYIRSKIDYVRKIEIICIHFYSLLYQLTITCMHELSKYNSRDYLYFMKFHATFKGWWCLGRNIKISVVIVCFTTYFKNYARHTKLFNNKESL